MSVRVTFVGSGDAFAGGGRFQTCLHLEADGSEPLLLDCGATSLMALKRLGIDPGSIGHVALTHLHGDHFGGLPWLVLDGQFANRTKPLEILGPTHTRERFAQAFEVLYPGSLDVERRFETKIAEYADRAKQDFGPARITAYPVRHTPATMPHGIRVEYADKVIAYSGDTEWTDTLPELARGADLFVCECNFFDIKAPGHLDYQTLTQHRQELECERIVITHMGEQMLARVDAGDVELEAAADGAVISV
ncbi:MAG TPA: MBL fold metallo-hydrolase [Solirubrobacteraceae bacterium]|nr:MBL fold metallo-hydrolase [Solirubrobacteraceae bacterium]